MKRWLFRVFVVLILAVVFHVMTVMFYPTGCLLALSMKGKKKGREVNRIYHAPRVTAASRQVVRPSPDLIYSVCAYDVSKAPLRITASVPDTYWSLSLYASNTDNFFVVNDRQVPSGEMEIILLGPGMAAPKEKATQVVAAPSKKGVALIRMLVTGEDRFAHIRSIQRQAKCEIVD